MADHVLCATARAERRGVGRSYPSLLVALMSAPAKMRAAAASTWPFFAANMSAVHLLANGRAGGRVGVLPLRSAHGASTPVSVLSGEVGAGGDEQLEHFHLARLAVERRPHERRVPAPPSAAVCRRMARS
jgi:hypothetical protein